MEIIENKYINHLKNVCSDYCMSAIDVYNLLISKDDVDFPLSFEIVKYKVLKDVSSDILQKIFTKSELKSIFSDINFKKIKNEETRKFVNTLR